MNHIRNFIQIGLVISFIGCKTEINRIEYIYNSKRVVAEITDKQITAQYQSNNVKQLQFTHSNNTVYQINLYENGLKETEGQITNNQKEGLWKNYYFNGTPKNHITYKSGKINGRIFEIDSLGGVRFVGTQKMGKLEGLATYFFEDGKIRKQGMYENGAPIGDWIRNE